VNPQWSIAMSTVLVVDDKDLLRDSVGATLRRAGYTVITAGDAASALEAIARRRPDAVVTDLKMPGMSGLELIEQARALDDEIPIVMMTAFGAVESAVSAMKLGAFDYLTKPFEGDELVVAVKRAIEHARLVRENAVLRRGAEGAASAGSAPGVSGLDRLVGNSPAMRRVKEQVRAVAESQGTVLICGESGTGKEVVARAVHDLSSRRDEPFLAVNCAALSESLLESELFGHEKGAFTGAERLRKGRFELAERGTLLLDEISEISTRVQAKLLRVLQERTLERVGSSVSIGVDVRVVATSNRDLPRSAAAGEFRQDLFFRLNVLPIHLPPLRDRLDDVPLLVQTFLRATAQREGRPAKSIEPGALGVMQAYPWPGNVRELQNICERAAVLCPGEVIEQGLVEPWLSAVPTGGMREPAPAVQLAGVGGLIGGGFMSEPKSGGFEREAALGVLDGRPLEDIEREAIVRTLHRFQGHRQRTASALGIGVRTLGLKLKKWKEMKLVEEGL
jgi:DNA-binding NtrC family response regulator